MFEKVVKNYYKLFDEKLENGTLVVLIIALIIVLLGSLLQDEKILEYSKTNLLEAHIIPSTPLNNKDIILIDGKKYQVIFQETK